MAAWVSNCVVLLEMGARVKVGRTTHDVLLGLLELGLRLSHLSAVSLILRVQCRTNLGLELLDLLLLVLANKESCSAPSASHPAPKAAIDLPSWDRSFSL